MVKEYGYEYDAVLNDRIWSETGGRVTDNKLAGAYCLRSGRDALKVIAREYEPCVVMLPALACDSMIHPFEQYGHTIKYYKLNADYSIDIDSIDIGGGRTLLLYMDYFGRTAIKEEILEQLNSNGNIIFIEDRTHNLIWKRKSVFKPNYIIASLRKWIPIPDGGLLWGNVSSTLGRDVSFSTVRLKAQRMRHEFLSCGDEEIKKEYRKIFSSVSDIMDGDEPSAMSAYSYALARETDWDEIRCARSRNAAVLTKVLSESPYITFIQNNTCFSDLYVPFTTKNRDEVQRKLSLEGIFNTIIWPLNEAQKDTCQIAKFTEKNMLAAPCDQRYTEDDMVYVGNRILKVIEDVNR